MKAVARGAGARAVGSLAVAIGPTCTACGACIITCPEKALRPAPRRPVVDTGACTGCLECIEVCPASAIRAISIAEQA